MEKRVSALKARTNLGEILNEVYYKGREIVIERKGIIMARIVPADRAADISKEERRDTLLKYAGVFKDLDTEAMKRNIAKARKMPARGTPLPSFYDGDVPSRY